LYSIVLTLVGARFTALYAISRLVLKANGY